MKYVSWLDKKIHFKTASIVFAVFLIIVLPVVNVISVLYLEIPESFDTMFSLSIDDYYQLRQTFSAFGANNYVVLRFTFDLIWPLVYLYFFMSVLVSGVKEEEGLKHFLIIAVLAFVFDLLENISASIFVLQDTSRDALVYLLMLSSLIKWILVFLAMFGSMRVIINLVKRSKNRV
jgi:hypothetical protein